jgi:chitin synthase
MQVIFCLKEKTQNRINSHRWFFNAFGPILQPNICVLLNVGTTPGLGSIYHLWKAFDINSDVGGACGEIVVLKGKYGAKLLNPLSQLPFYLCTSPPFLTPCVTIQWLPRTLSTR